MAQKVSDVSTAVTIQHATDEQGNVLMIFGKPVEFLRMNARQALDCADSILECTKRVAPAKAEAYKWPK